MGFLDGIRRAFSSSYDKVDCFEAAEMVKKGAVLIDVRTPAEYRLDHARGAVNIPVDAIGARGPAACRGRVAVLICRSGARSRSAARILAAQGVECASVKGGMGAWRRKGL